MVDNLGKTGYAAADQAGRNQKINHAQRLDKRTDQDQRVVPDRFFQFRPIDFFK